MSAANDATVAAFEAVLSDRERRYSLYREARALTAAFVVYVARDSWGGFLGYSVADRAAAAAIPGAVSVRRLRRDSWRGV